MMIIVGQRFPTTKLLPIPEYNFIDGQHLLIISYPHLTSSEIKAVETLPPRFAFSTLDDGRLINFQYRFGNVLPWSDCGFSVHNVPLESRITPPIYTGDERALISIILVNYDTGIVEATRLVSLSPTFSQEIGKVITEQAVLSPPENMNRAFTNHWDRFTSKEIRGMAIASCIGGDNKDRPSSYTITQ